MEIHDILASIQVSDNELGIPGGEISAEIEASDENAALAKLQGILRDLATQGGRSFSVQNSEIISSDDDRKLISVTIGIQSVPEINWITFYYDLESLDLDDPEEADPSELASMWVNDFFDEDNEIIMDQL